MEKSASVQFIEEHLTREEIFTIAQNPCYGCGADNQGIGGFIPSQEFMEKIPLQTGQIFFYSACEECATNPERKSLIENKFEAHFKKQN